jgi:hypothetical protein
MPVCPAAPDSWQLRSRHVPRGSSSRHQAPRQLRDRHMPRGPGSRLLAHDSSGTTMCPVGRSCGLHAIKVNKYLLAARLSWSPSGCARVSSKALRDKDGAYKTCRQVGCRSVPAQCRPAAHSQWVATVRSGSTTLVGMSVRQVATV